MGYWDVGIGNNDIAWMHDCIDVGCGVLIAVSMITGEETSLNPPSNFLSSLQRRMGRGEPCVRPVKGPNFF